MSRLVSAEELLVLSHSNTGLISIATILLKLIFPNLLGPLKLKATRMTAFNHQYFQVYFDSAVHIISPSKKDHTFFIWKSSYYATWYRPLILRSYICWMIAFKVYILVSFFVAAGKLNTQIHIDTITTRAANVKLCQRPQGSANDGLVVL